MSNLLKGLFRVGRTPSLLIAAFSVLVLLSDPASGQVVCNENGQTTPNGLGNFFIMNADGVFDPMDIFYELPPGSTFDVGVLGRTPAEAAQRQQDAYSFFLNKYGIEFNGGVVNPDGTVLSTDGGAILFHTAVDSRWNQRVIYSGGDVVPLDGWVVEEARYAASVVSPGYVLTGTWGGAGGEPVPYGTTMADGEWVFRKVVPCFNSSDGSAAADDESIIHLRYQTDYPFVPDFLNRAAVEYDITPISGVSSTRGVAIGRIELNHLAGDLIQAIVKIGIRLW